jgi:hypothetical protein
MLESILPSIKIGTPRPPYMILSWTLIVFWLTPRIPYPYILSALLSSFFSNP